MSVCHFPSVYPFCWDSAGLGQGQREWKDIVHCQAGRGHLTVGQDTSVSCNPNECYVLFLVQGLSGEIKGALETG